MLCYFKINKKKTRHPSPMHCIVGRSKKNNALGMWVTKIPQWLSPPESELMKVFNQQ